MHAHLPRSLLQRSLCATLLVSSASAQEILFESKGQTFTESLGYSLAPAGDLDGDQHADWLAGGPHEGQSGSSAGLVRAYAGVDGSLLFTLNGSFPGDDFGFAIDGGQDIDGDGVDDVLVGAPDLVSTGGHAPLGGGYAEVRSGANGAVLHHWVGDAADDMFGYSVAFIGDVDGGGICDIAVGAIGDDDGGDAAGSVRVFSGETGFRMYTLHGAAAGDVFGARLARVGNVDGDGLPDYAIAAPGSDVGGNDRGAVLLVSGFDGVELHEILGLANQDRLGRSLAHLGDVDLDGRDDVLVGANLADSNGQDAGSVYAFSGLDGSLIWSAAGTDTSDYLGFSVSGVGDVDLDGIPDAAAGGPTENTFGSFAGRVVVLSGASGAELTRIWGHSGEYLGWSLAGAGDVDADGQPDLLVGGIGQSGRARVYRLGDPVLPLTYCSPKFNSQGCAPTLSASGSPTLTGPDDFAVHADLVINQKPGLFIWSPAPAATPFGNGTLCLAAPVKRTTLSNSGGSVGPDDCSGQLSFGFSQAYLAQEGLSAGSFVYTQAWYRDPALPFNAFGLTNAIQFVVAP